MNSGLIFFKLGWTVTSCMTCISCIMVWYSLCTSFCRCAFMFFNNNVVVLFVAKIVSLARAIDVVIAGWPAGLSMISSGVMDGEPGLELSLPALCLDEDENDVKGGTAVDTSVLDAVTILLSLCGSRLCLDWSMVLSSSVWYRSPSATRFGITSSSGGLPGWVSKAVEGDGDCLSECPMLLVSIRTLWLALFSSIDVEGISGSPGQ